MIFALVVTGVCLLSLAAGFGLGTYLTGRNVPALLAKMSVNELNGLAQEVQRLRFPDGEGSASERPIPASQPRD